MIPAAAFNNRYTYISLKDFYMRCLCFGMFSMLKQAYIESQSKGRNPCRNKKGSLSLTKRRETVSSVSREKPEATVAHLLLS
jgi:hypothetical protein